MTTNAFSFGGVIALWLGTSFLFWLGHRLWLRRGDAHRLAIARSALDQVSEARTVFAAIRGARANPARRGSLFWSATASGEDALKDDVRALLNLIEANSPFFDAVKDLRKRFQRTFPASEESALSEILQIRRDLWASAEIILVEDLKTLGPGFSDPDAYDAFRMEAQALLFGPVTLQADTDDPIALRLALAFDDAQRFAAQLDADIQTEAAKRDLPRPSDFIAYPVRALKVLPAAFRALRTSAREIAAAATSLAGAMNAVKQPDAMAWGLGEIRRARDDLPQRFAAAVEKAGGLARQGGKGLRRHYDFLLEARDLQARYMEALQAAPDFSERGRQFIARLELAKKAEQMRLTSLGLFSRLRNALVVAISGLISGLQRLQAWLTPPEKKQLAVVLAPAKPVGAGAPPVQPASPAEPLLLAHRPALSEALNGAASGPAGDTVLPKDNLARVRALFHGRRPRAARPADALEGLADRSLAGSASEIGRPPKPEKSSKPRVLAQHAKPAADSLLSRLTALQAGDPKLADPDDPYERAAQPIDARPHTPAGTAREPERQAGMKRSRFRLFSSKR